MNSDSHPAIPALGPPLGLLRFPKIAAIYQRFEKYIGVIVFAAGFIWDSITITRVDSWIDNTVLLLYLTAIGVMIIFTLRRQCGISSRSGIRRLDPHYLWAMQFCFGGMFSSFVVFYFKSVSWTGTQFFLVILIVLLVGNEFLQQRLQNPSFLAALYSFCLISYLAFFLPVVLARIGPDVFLLAASLSLLISLSVFAAAYWPQHGEWRRHMTPIATCVFSIFIIVNLLYFANLIPPVPLSLKSAGIYHSVTRMAAGYEVQYVPPPFYRFWQRWDDPFYLTSGESAYCYTAIFAPPKIRVPIRHVWSRKTPNGWVPTDHIVFEISGGREAGFRGFTRKTLLWPGECRVDVETERGQILGRIEFTILESPAPHPLLETHIIP